MFLTWAKYESPSDTATSGCGNYSFLSQLSNIKHLHYHKQCSTRNRNMVSCSIYMALFRV